jgi:O-antigen ligase/polysaccharide polymerase Wzy-like membrane protein
MSSPPLLVTERPAYAIPRGVGGIGRIRSGAAPPTFWERLLVGVILLSWLLTVVLGFRTALTLLWTIGLGAAVVGVRFPRLGLLGVGILCSLHGFAAPLLLRGGLWRWNTVNYLLLLVALLFWPYLLRVGRSQNRVLLAFILLLGSEILLSADVENGIQHVFSVVPVFGLLIYFRRGARDPDDWHWFALVTGILAAVGTGVFLLQQARLPVINRNAWSYVPLTALFALSLAFVTAGDLRRRGLALTLLATVNALWVFLSGSRGAILTAAVCLLFMLSQMRLRRALLFGCVGTLVSLVVLSQFTTLREKAVGRLGLLADPAESLTRRTSGRFDLVAGAWQMFKDHPFGVGTGGFSASWEEYVSDPRDEGGSASFRREHPIIAAHSAWGKVLAENGLPGILLLCAYVFSFTLSGWRTRSPDLLRLGVTVTAALAAAWVSTEFWNPGLWLLAAGATVVLDRYPGAALRG